MIKLILLLLILLLVFLLSYVFYRNYISPISVFVLSFIMATAIVIANDRNWDLHISVKLLPYIMSAIIAFGAGCFLIEGLFRTSVFVQKSTDLDRDHRKRLCGPYPSFFFAVVSIGCTVFYVFFVMTKMSFSGGISTILRNLYVTATNIGNNNFFLNQAREIATAIAEITIFELFVIKYIDNNKNIKLLHIIPIGCFILLTAASTDRNIFIRFALFSISLWILFFLSSNHKNIENINRKILKKTVFFALVFIIAFYGLGKLKRYTSNLERMIGIYGGSGLYNFNIYIDNPERLKLSYGQDTFSELRQTLQALGFFGDSVSDTPAHGEFITFVADNGYVYSSNIYSALRPYLHDFGYWGLWIFPFSLGVIFGSLYRNTRKRICGFHWILYSLLIYSLAYAAVAEQFFKRLHLGMVYEIGWAFIIYVFAYWIKPFDKVRLKIRG